MRVWSPNFPVPQSPSDLSQVLLVVGLKNGIILEFKEFKNFVWLRDLGLLNKG
jgi:hypothetical protein